MMRWARRSGVLVLALGVLGTLAACALYKPVRVLAPQRFGLICPSSDICVEDLSTLAEARALRSDALAFVASELGPIADPPRLLFCSTQACFVQFGNPEVAAFYMWGLDTVLINGGHREGYILRHEVIHHWQVETFGLAYASSRKARWFIEGMAYSLSEDPRHTIPNVEAQGYRDRFEAWLAQGNDWRQPPRKSTL